MTDPHDDVGRAIRATAERVQAPLALRERIAQDRTPARRRRGGFALLAAGLGAAAALAATIVLLAGGLDRTPDVSEAASVALQAPTIRSVASIPSVGDVAFPHYGTRWRPVGVRTGTLAGRSVVAVTYASGAQRIGYAIVAGDPLPIPGGTASTTPHGTPAVLTRAHGASVVTWRRGGHTCVVASRTATPAQLLAFVDWRT